MEIQYNKRTFRSYNEDFDEYALSKNTINIFKIIVFPTFIIIQSVTNEANVDIKSYLSKVIIFGKF